MLGALLWVIYGVVIGAAPVIVANVLVFSAAAWTRWRTRPADAAYAAPLPRHALGTPRPQESGSG
jgi:hypothetical protein